MRRPPVASTVRAFGRAGAVVLALAVVLPACNDKPTDGDTEERTDDTTPELIPFESTTPETDPPETDPPDTEPEEESDESEPEETEPDVQEIDPMPGDTATFDTRPPDDALCEAVQAILDADDDYQEVLADALTVAADDPDALVKALRKLPLDDIRSAYDDLEDEVPENLRARVRLIRDFTLEHGEALAEVEDLEQLSALIAEIEDDPDAARVTKATKAVSAYTDDECGIPLAQGG